MQEYERRRYLEELLIEAFDRMVENNDTEIDKYLPKNFQRIQLPKDVQERVGHLFHAVASDVSYLVVLHWLHDPLMLSYQIILVYPDDIYFY